MFWIVIWLFVLVGWIASFVLIGLSWWWLLQLTAGPIVLFLIGLAIIWWKLAPRDIFFTLISEGHARIVVKGASESEEEKKKEREVNGAFDKILKVWQGHYMDKDWNIRVADAEHPAEERRFGGLFYYGFYPWKRIKRTHFQWTNLLDTGEKKKYDEKVDQFRLMTQPYVFDIPLSQQQAAEDINGVPIGFDLVLPIEIENLYTGFFLYDTWLSMLNGVIKPITKRFVARYRFKEDLTDMRAGTGIEELQEEKGVIRRVVVVDPETGQETTEIRAESEVGEDLRDRLWFEIAKAFGEDVQEPEDVEEKLHKYGVVLHKGGMDIMDIDPDPEYRKLTTARYQEEKKAEVAKIKGGGIADEIAARLAGPVVKALAQTYGKDEKVIQKEIDAGQYSDEIPDLRKEARRREAIDADQYREHNYPEGKESSNILDRAVDALRNPMGGGKPTQQKPAEGGGKTDLIGRKERSEAEIEQILNDKSQWDQK